MNTRHQCFRCFVAVSVRQAIAVGAPLLERQQDGCAEMNAVKLKSVVQCMYVHLCILSMWACRKSTEVQMYIHGIKTVRLLWLDPRRSLDLQTTLLSELLLRSLDSPKEGR